jgi:Cu/Ag efflux protein CusF
LIASSLVILSGASFAQMGNMPMSKDTPKAAAKSASGRMAIALNGPAQKITFDHVPILESDWPAMKMEFPVAS